MLIPKLRACLARTRAEIETTLQSARMAWDLIRREVL